jgi:putative transposase
MLQAAGFRDECLNQHWFVNLAQARQISATWRDAYNTQRPRSDLAERTPAEYASVSWPTAISHYPWAHIR